MRVRPLVLWLFTLAVSLASGRAAERPNVVFILADDLGWADVPWHGSPYKMPHLERMAREGLRLEANYVHPMCSPTRAALLSGRYASRFGVTAAQNELAMPFGTPTLASLLKQAGYATALVGKWHLGSKPEQGPQKFGFDFSYGSLAGGCSQYSHLYKRGEFSETWHRNGALIHDEGHTTDLIARESVRWIESRGEEPFFLYVPFTAIHIPMEEPENWQDANPSLTEPGERLRGACASHMDDAIGQIVAAVEERGWSGKTMFLFMGDNGAHEKLGNFDRKFPGEYPDVQVGNNNLPWRGYKSQVYEGGVRTPGVAYWPGKIAAGRTERPVQAPDWLPTLCALAGVKLPTNVPLDGMDVTKVLLQVPGETAPREIYSAAPQYRARMLRRGEWKLVVTTTASKQAKVGEELFNLAADPGETRNVAGEHPEVLASLKARLAEIAQSDQQKKTGAE